MNDLGWILLGGFLMAGVALVGGLTTVMSPATLERLLLPLVSLAAGTLIGGAVFHMMPHGMEALPSIESGIWMVGGFSSFLLLEQFLHWHHSHHPSPDARTPASYLILIGDAAHNFLGGMGIASTFLISPKAGIVAWAAAAAHEVPQELGDFGILVHGGWKRGQALFWNFISALTFPLGAVLVYFVSLRFDVAGLVLFGAGNFIYIAASDLVPEIKASPSLARAAVHFGCFAFGVALMIALAYGFD